MTEFIALRSKMYAYKTKEKEDKKLKGIPKNIVKRKIKFEDYKESLERNKVFKHSFNTLRSDKHNMFLSNVEKCSLSPFDDKRYILSNGINTLPYGYSELPCTV